MSAMPLSRSIAAGFVFFLLPWMIPIGAKADEATKPEPCAADTANVDYARKADLPAGATDALGPMAEAGAPFQATDVIIKKGLPWRRFISARKAGCRLHVELEHGGIGLRRESIDLDFADGKWKVHKP